jgi:phosphatidylinositol alpha 1,6-mannosyltransferase
VPRLLCCTDTWPPQVNGVSIVTALSIAGLAARGWECAVIAPRCPGAPQQAADADLTVVPSIPMPRYPQLRLALVRDGDVRKVVRRFAPDLVHSATEFLIGRAGQREALRAGVPSVSSYHTDFAKYTAAYGMPWLREPVMRSIVRFHQRARRTYTPGRPAAGDLAARNVEHVEVWGRGVDIETFNPAKRDASLRQRLGIEGRFTFLHVSRLAPEKGTDIVVAAYKRACQILPPDSTRLVIAGEGPAEAALRAAAPPHAIFLGFVDRATELPGLYASCDAFCFASLTETLGLVILEAMACGLPVLATPAGGVADHLRDGVNGLAFPARSADALAQAMVRVATDDTLHATLSRGARQTAEALSWEEELDRLDASYRDVLRESRAGES